jgi:hypothetical protein
MHIEAPNVVLVPRTFSHSVQKDDFTSNDVLIHRKTIYITVSVIVGHLVDAKRIPQVAMRGLSSLYFGKLLEVNHT